MEEELSEFIKWISSADPIARKIRFVVVGGDLIDGVGVFPGQEKILNQTTTEGQLQKMMMNYSCGGWFQIENQIEISQKSL